jgi:hypothetical protein
MRTKVWEQQHQWPLEMEVVKAGAWRPQEPELQDSATETGQAYFVRQAEPGLARGENLVECSLLQSMLRHLVVRQQERQARSLVSRERGRGFLQTAT